MEPGSAKFQTAYDHYKDCLSPIHQNDDLRDKLFVIISVIIVLMLFEIYTPGLISTILPNALSEKLELKTRLDFSFFKGVIWFGLLSAVLRFYQTEARIKYLHGYIRPLEGAISPSFDGRFPAVESDATTGDYRTVRKTASFFHGAVFPVLLLAVASDEIITELQNPRLSLLLIFDVFAYLSTTVSTLVFLYETRFKR